MDLVAAQDSTFASHRALLGLLLHHAPVKRTRLVELTGATQSTVTRWVGSLMAAGVVREVGSADAEVRPGRPATQPQSTPAHEAPDMKGAPSRRGTGLGMSGERWRTRPDSNRRSPA